MPYANARGRGIFPAGAVLCHNTETGAFPYVEGAGAKLVAKKAIIIVDCSELFRRGLGELLRGEGYEIAGVAGNREDALALTAAYPDCVMLVGEALEGGGDLISTMHT